MKKAKTILKLSILVGIIIILGTAGASDLGRLSINESLSQIILGIILMFCGNAGLSLIKLCKSGKRKNMRFQKNKPCKHKTANAA